MSKRLENLNTIIGVLNSGAKFYRSASRQVGRQDLGQVFVEHADLRETVSRDLSQMVDDAGAEPAGLSPMEEAHAVKTKLGTLFNETDAVLVAALEEHEDRTLAAIRNALHHKDNHRDEEMLRGLLARFQETHDRMRAMKSEVRLTGPTHTTREPEIRETEPPANDDVHHHEHAPERRAAAE